MLHQQAFVARFLLFCFACMGLELAPAQLLLQLCFYPLAPSIPVIKHMLYELRYDKYCTF